MKQVMLHLVLWLAVLVGGTDVWIRVQDWAAREREQAAKKAASVQLYTGTTFASDGVFSTGQAVASGAIATTPRYEAWRCPSCPIEVKCEAPPGKVLCSAQRLSGNQEWPKLRFGRTQLDCPYTQSGEQLKFSQDDCGRWYCE